ncbi:MAG: hypothetical protein AAF298_17870 [Cyanobacteria bacterium P01_A01_bin.40]
MYFVSYPTEERSHLINVNLFVLKLDADDRLNTTQFLRYILPKRTQIHRRNKYVIQQIYLLTRESSRKYRLVFWYFGINNYSKRSCSGFMGDRDRP